MEPITKIIENNKESRKELLEQIEPLKSSIACLKKTDIQSTKSEDPIQFLQKYNPDYQKEICTNAEICFFGDFPTLAKLGQEYGKNMPIVWLIPQIINLSEYCGVKEKLSDAQLEDLAFVISTTYYYLKISELMLFFFRFKQGRYGRFYGNIDPLIITNALIEFRLERIQLIEEKEQQQRREERDKMFRKATAPPKEFLCMIGKIK